MRFRSDLKYGFWSKYLWSWTWCYFKISSYSIWQANIILSRDSPLPSSVHGTCSQEELHNIFGNFNVSITSTSVYQSIYSFILKLILNEPLSFESYFIVLGWLRTCKSRPSLIILKMKINQNYNKWTHSCILYNTHLKVIFQHSISLWKCLFSKGNTVLKKYLNGNHLSWFFRWETWKIQVE